MSDPFLAHMRATLDQIRADGFYKSERVIGSPQASQIGIAGGRAVHGRSQLLREQLPRPGRPSAACRARRKNGLDACGLRHGVGALHLRHAERAQGARSRARRVPRHRGHHPLLELLRRQRRPVRDAARRGGRDHQRRAEPRQHHRRHPALQGASASATATTTWPTSRPSSRRRMRRVPLQADRHRRRVLDGRHHRRPDGDLRPGRPLRRAGDGRRLARRRASSARGPRHAGALRRDGPRWTSSPARWARRWAARRAATRRAGARSSSCCASARGRTSSPTRWRPCIAAASLDGAGAPAQRRGRQLRAQLRENGEHFRRGDDGARASPRARAASDHPGDARRRGAGDAHGRRAAGRGRLRDRLFLSGGAAGARRASARRCPRRTPTSSSTARSRRSRRSAATLGQST